MQKKRGKKQRKSLLKKLSTGREQEKVRETQLQDK